MALVRGTHFIKQNERVRYEVDLQMLEVTSQQFISTQQPFAVLLRQLLLLYCKTYSLYNSQRRSL